jgi:hypothetical protein
MVSLVLPRAGCGAALGRCSYVASTAGRPVMDLAQHHDGGQGPMQLPVRPRLRRCRTTWPNELAKFPTASGVVGRRAEDLRYGGMAGRFGWRRDRWRLAGLAARGSAGLTAAGRAVVAGAVGAAWAVEQGHGVTSLRRAGRGRRVLERTTRRPRLRLAGVPGRPGRAGAPAAGSVRLPGRGDGRARLGPRRDALAAGSRCAHRGHRPRSATWRSSPISRSRSPARWAPLISRRRATASWS